MSRAVQRTCEEHARRGDLVVMAGAGVSAGPPSSIPGWYPLNAAIFAALRARVEAGIDKPGWLEEAEPYIAGARTAGRFPPDYQAQVIEEMCGERYFRGLQALDIDVGNAAHEAIAALAAGGALRAVVTTNFDRLIERALERRGVAFTPAFDEAGFAAVGDGPLPVIKVHGCVSSPGSMVDTWKQRVLGRSQLLTECMAPLHDAFWVYAGFSAADLEDDASYLGLVAGARRSPGAVYLAFPGNPELGPGVQTLMGAYGERGETAVAGIAEYLGGLGGPPRTPVTEDGPIGRARVEQRLGEWAGGLSVSAAGLCVAAILEAVGQGEPAVRVLDRLVRKEIYEERGTPDFRALQLAYGRLGGAFGRFVAVPDLQGAASNASVESVQSLLRIQDDDDAGFLARAWLAPMLLWLGYGGDATTLAVPIVTGFTQGGWDGPQPRGDEEVVDAWLCAAQVLVLNANSDTARVLVGTVPAAIERARAAGDLVREARVAALHLLTLAETREDVPALAEAYEPVFAHARRVDDGVAFGFRALALGHWHAGDGGRSPALLGEAAARFTALGTDPWLLYARIQGVRALAAVSTVDEVNETIQGIRTELGRFPVLATFFYEMVAQLQAAAGDADAGDNYAHAVQTALEAGLRARHQRLAAILESAG